MLSFALLHCVQDAIRLQLSDGEARNRVSGLVALHTYTRVIELPEKV